MKPSPPELEIAPGIKARPAFKSKEEYEKFCSNYRERTEPIFKKYKIARMESEAAAKKHVVY